jgi:hypothetical protein
MAEHEHQDKIRFYETEIDAIMASGGTRLKVYWEEVDGKPESWALAPTEHQYRTMLRAVPKVGSLKGIQIDLRLAEIYRQRESTERE